MLKIDNGIFIVQKVLTRHPRPQDLLADVIVARKSLGTMRNYWVGKSLVIVYDETTKELI